MKIQSKTFLLVILSFQSNFIVVHQMIDIIYPPFHAIFFFHVIKAVSRAYKL